MSLTHVLREAHWWNSTEAMPDYVSNKQVAIGNQTTHFSGQNNATCTPNTDAFYVGTLAGCAIVQDHLKLSMLMCLAQHRGFTRA